MYLKFADDDPPEVARNGDGLTVTVRDLLTAGEELAIPVDLVVLVTGMVPRQNEELVRALKLPIGRDGFFNEIHPKLRPVETVVDGVLIAGACQGPKTVAESVASGLAAVTQAAAVLKRGVAELDPQVARVHADACTGCADCVPACPFGAISLVARDGGEVAVDRRRRLQGLRRVRARLPRGRDRPAGLHRRADPRDDRRPARGSGVVNRDTREVVRDEPLCAAGCSSCCGRPADRARARRGIRPSRGRSDAVDDGPAQVRLRRRDARGRRRLLPVRGGEEP